MPARTPTPWIAAALIVVSSTVGAQDVQQHVHEHGHQVMPFDLARTLHVFQMTQDGGIEQVVTRGDAPDAEQARLIQHHLMKEAEAFQRGDFSDPAHLHGAAMPGLQELQAGAAQVRISYHPLPTGAEIVFTTSDIRLITAIHRWFGAQLSEHGADAQAR
ncbi:MAG: aspartate carbamoyltransferase [Burkholderiaceae bacterium]